ncbi:matrin-3-like isoform X2 [Myxocyprinus asiaticus]|uniref:matrin-3-like isoform X2 n=1 Tax=Myxocyprinus asiaticus TaxID=70543 RepID=UPI0022225645|nr:matrin-3-like isoform X2 [Myxocyprinus asiaticus]
MSQKLTNVDAQKGVAVGRVHLVAAETLKFSVCKTHTDPYGSSSQSHSGMAGLIGGEGKDWDTQLSHRAGSHISNTMKLFASLGLSPADLDALAQVPEENISVETLPQLILQLKNRKMEAGHHMASEPSRLSSETSYRGSREDWGDMQVGRLDRSIGQSQSRSHGDFGYSSMCDTSDRGYDMVDYGSSGGREGQYSELSHDSYRSLGVSTSSASDNMFMQRRMGAPSQGKVQDFLGVMPPMFPYVCALCDFDVHSVMEWTRHTTGIRHSENCRILLQMYPDWDPHLPSAHMATSLSLDTKSRQDGLLGAAPVGAGLQRSGMSSSWGSDSSMGMTNKSSSYAAAPKIRSRVVVAKYDRKPLSSNTLFAFAKPFGAIREHLVLNNKAFLELQTHEEALAMANYYQRKPAILNGKEIRIYLSKELLVIKNNLATMDPVEESTLRSTLSQQEALLGRQQDQISASNRALEMMASQLAQLTSVVQQLRQPPDAGPILVDQRLDLRRCRSPPTRAADHHTQSTVSARSLESRSDTEPMQDGRARISHKEKRRRLIQGLCFYCGQSGHVKASCPVKDTGCL